MSEFWLWFWRPIAETLGVVAMLVGLCGGFYLWIWIAGVLERRKRRKQDAAAKRKAEVEARGRMAL